MKKVFKILGIIIIIIIVLVGGYFIFLKVSDLQSNNKSNKTQKQLNEERINAKTLTDYIKTRSCEYSQYENCDYDYEIKIQDFKCDSLDKDIKLLADEYFITKDNEIYEISFNKLYSNNQNCNKKDLSFEIKDIIIENTGVGAFADILTKDNKVYTIDYFGNIEEETRPEQKQWIIDATKKDVKAIIYPLMYFNYDMISGKTTSIILVLKNDNKIYKQYFNTGYVGSDSVVKLTKEETIKSLEEYGNISNILLYNYTTQDNADYNIKDDDIMNIISDKGYYYISDIETDECIKYEDVKCEKELKESEIYKRFSNDIKVIGNQYTILSDNSVISTNILKKELDKNLK